MVRSFDGLISCEMVSSFLKERFSKMLARKNASGFNRSGDVVISCQRLESIEGGKVIGADDRKGALESIF